MMKNFNIIFMGTPEFAVPSLKAIHSSNHSISFVITQPDRPKGRGRKVLPSPAKQAADDLGYRVLQPTSVNDAEFVEAIVRTAPDFLVVVAYGRILPKAILALPKMGTINLHASLLPKYRGPAPIQWAIINGETVTGVTTMLMDEGMDTGDILMTATEKISSVDTSATLHDRLARIGANLLVDTLDRYSKGQVRPIPQDHDQATQAPLLKKSDGRIAWDAPADKISAFIRGMTPWPGAYTYYKGKSFKIFDAKPIRTDVAQSAGTVIKGFPDELRVATAKGVLSVLEIQGASGKRLRIADFLRGYAMPPGTVFE